MRATRYNVETEKACRGKRPQPVRREAASELSLHLNDWFLLNTRYGDKIICIHLGH